MQSDIPIGCGMGSSAATILSVVHAIAHHLKVDLSPEIFFRLGLEAENMQHGYSSGLDLRVSLHGGCILVKDGQTYQRSIPELPMYLINTGVPKTTTGECVAHAAAFFKNATLHDEFAAVTEAFDQALQTNHLQNTKFAVRANHQLLVKIGVVPELVRQFIAEVNHVDGAAKICGAGAVTGNKGGVVLVVAENITALADLCAKYHYSILPINGEPRGVHFV